MGDFSGPEGNVLGVVPDSVVSHRGYQKPGAWAIICCTPGTLAGKWSSWDSNQYSAVDVGNPSSYLPCCPAVPTLLGCSASSLALAFLTPAPRASFLP